MTELVRGAVVLVAVLGVAVAVAWARGEGGPDRREAVLSMAAVSLVAALGGWIVARWPQSTAAGRTAAVLAAILLRTLPPLATLAWLQAGENRFRDAGAAGLLATFYLTLLATDVFLTIMGTRTAGSRKARGGAGAAAVD